MCDAESVASRDVQYLQQTVGSGTCVGLITSACYRDLRVKRDIGSR